MRKIDLGLPKYMGRGIIAGFTTDYKPAVIYFAQGRSPPSRRRKLVAFPDEGIVKMEPNSETSIEEMRESGGNPALLLYNAMRGDRDGLLVVSNGFQTDCDPIWEGEGREKENLKGAKPGGGIYHLIKKGYEKGIAKPGYVIWDAVYRSLGESGSEVDSIRTARIACVIDTEKDPLKHYMGIIVRERDIDNPSTITSNDQVMVERFEHDPILSEGKFVMCATYGVHEPPFHAALPPPLTKYEKFTKMIDLDGLNSGELAEEVWMGLPKEIMVGIAAAMRDESRPNGFRFAVKNMRE